MQELLSDQQEFKVASKVEEIVTDFFASNLILDDLSHTDKRFLVAYWVHFFTHSSLAVWFNDGHGQERLETRFDSVPANTAAYMSLNRTESYLAYLKSTLSNCEVIPKLNVEKTNSILQLRKSRRIDTLLYNSGFSKAFCFFLILFSFGRISTYCKEKRIVAMPVDPKERSELVYKLRNHLRDFSFGNWYAARALEFFPTIFIEDFEQITKIYRNYTGKIRKMIFSRDCWSSDDNLKLLSVLASGQDQQKIFKLGAPHSLNYGCLKNFWLRDYESRYLDRYLGWGLNSSSAEAFYPSQYAGRRRPCSPKRLKTNFEFLITGAARPGHTIEHPYSFSKYLIYLERQIELANNLATSTGRKVTIRTRQMDRGRVLENIVAEKDKELFSIEYQSGNLLKRLKGCLHISDNPSTSIIETFWAKYPTLILILPGYFEIAPEASEEFNILRKANVLHDNIESLIEFVTMSLSELNAWWSSSSCQTAVSEFLEFQSRPGASFREWRAQLLSEAK